MEIAITPRNTHVVVCVVVSTRRLQLNRTVYTYISMDDVERTDFRKYSPHHRSITSRVWRIVLKKLKKMRLFVFIGSHAYCYIMISCITTGAQEEATDLRSQISTTIIQTKRKIPFMSIKNTCVYKYYEW